ncbi:MAG: EfeM/EfeO family lipoprotein [Anaerolineae bacterium]|nr:EfeM/EfeO family lipoprotein [Anaerolineae bacterium]
MNRPLRMFALAAVVMLMLPRAFTFAQTPVQNDLSGIKTYLVGKATDLNKSVEGLKAASDTYYSLAKDAAFDYAVLWKGQQQKVAEVLRTARSAWMTASPLYEQMEGIVAGVPSLSHYDVILDSGTSAEDDPATAVPFDIKLPDGKVLPKPGNLFGLLESTLWGTRPQFSSKVQADLDGNGKRDFGDQLPDANALKGMADAMLGYTSELFKAAEQWQPTSQDAFTALVVMVPTMSEYFESWKQSRFIAGEQSTQADFVVISRLADIQDIVSSLIVIYQNVSPMVAAVNAAQDRQIAKGLEDLKAFASDLYQQEKDGKRFTAEEADLFGSEAQKRAETITGQITQVAAQLKIELP